jgi:2-dehydro-3-deoxygluconokinase
VTDFVTLGETMALLTAPRVGRLQDMTSLSLGIAGAESNVAIGLSRLGYKASWIGRVGADEFGKLIRATLRKEAVDVGQGVIDPSAATGIMVKERRIADLARVIYYRLGSAGSQLCADDVDEALVASARILHVTGITPALSESARAAVYRAVEIARGNGVLVSFDVNYRSALWSPAEAGKVLRVLAQRADVIFAGEDELRLLDDSSDSVVCARRLADEGNRSVIIKRGADGATSVSPSGVLDEPAIRVTAVDPIGAGDAFVAGYLAATLDGADERGRLSLGCRTGAFAVTVLGDWEGLPSRDELDLLEHRAGTTLR